ncbi:TolC family protein [Sphaerotilaceae bacterium SBD11-9]
MVILWMAGPSARQIGVGRRLQRSTACLFAVCAFGFSAQPWAAPLTFQEALRLAEQRAPMLTARQAAVGSAQLSGAAAGQLPDPKLAVGVENYPVSGANRFSWSGEPMTMRRVGVMQEVPNAARRAAQRESAEAKVAREQALLDAERLAVHRETAVAWLGQHYAERKLQLFATLERENQILSETLAARIAGGKALPADALMAKQEALGLAERRDELQAAVVQARAMLERWTGSPGETEASSPALAFDSANLLQRLDRHGELLPSVPMLTMARAEIAEAQASRRGDWGWEVTYANRDRAYGDMVSFQLIFDLPVSPSTRQDPQIAAKRKELNRLEAERDDALRRVRAELQGQVAELRRLELALERQRAAVVPLVTERVQLTLASYEGGRADLASVLTARKDAAEAQWRTLDLEAQLMSQRARLVYLIAE